MTKIKFMLMAIAVVAAVGGGLAFKAKKFAVKYCTATQSGICKFSALSNFDPLVTKVWYTPTSNLPNCTINPPVCLSSTSITVE